MHYRSLIGLIVVVLLAVSCSRTQITNDQRSAQPATLVATTIAQTTISRVEPSHTQAPFIIYEPIEHTPTQEYRLFAQKECSSYIEEPGPPSFTINCWHGLVNGHDFFVDANGVRHKPANYAIVAGFLTVYKNGEFVNDFHFPVELGGLTIVREMLPSLVIAVGEHFEALFNLETYQWTDLEGMPIVLNPTTTIWPTIFIPTIAPRIEILGVSLLDGDTNQPIPGFDPMPNPATIILDSLPTKHFNLQVHTNPATIGYVTFLFDGDTAYRTDDTPPYTFVEISEKWSPQVGIYQLAVVANNTTDWERNGTVIKLIVSKHPITPTIETKATPAKK